MAREERPLGGAQRTYHVHHRGSNASIHNWRRTRYAQGFDETQPESQIAATARAAASTPN